MAKFKKRIISLFFCLLAIVAVSGCSSSSTQDFNIGNSTFSITGDWEEIHNVNGTDVSRLRLDSSSKSIIISKYGDKSLYQTESKNANNTKTISGIECKMIPGQPAIVFFEKNGNYFGITVQSLDSNNNFEQGTSEDVKYIKEIISSLN